SPHSLHDALPSWRWSGDDGTCVHHLVSGVAASVVARQARSRAGIGGGMIMAHDPTRHWPLGVGPENTSIPGAAWLELLDGQVFPVVGAGAMVWNGTMWVPVSDQNRLPVEATLSGHSSPPTLVRINSDTVVPAGTSVSWNLSSSERAEIDRWPVFAIVLSWKVGSTDLDYT